MAATPEGALDTDRAVRLLNRAGTRIMRTDAGITIGLWSDKDAPHIRAALLTLGMDGLPVRYLDGEGIPARYKVRGVAGQPVALSKLREMEARS